MVEKLKRLYHQLGSPRYFYQISGKFVPWLAVFSAAILAIGVVWALLFAPADYQQGHSFRIIYIHVPTAILAQSCYMLMAAAGAVGLIWKMKLADMVAKASAPLGASFTLIALVTGSIWGKPTWGTWWIWDARLTSMLVLLFLYIGIIAMHGAIQNVKNASKATAILALVGAVNIPIIKFSVDWWNTLHQPATFKLTEKPAMPPDMWIPLLICVIGFYVLFSLLLLMRTRCEIIDRERRSKWVRLMASD